MAKVSKKKVSRKGVGESATASSTAAIAPEAPSSQKSEPTPNHRDQHTSTHSGQAVANEPPKMQKKSGALLAVFALLIAIAALAAAAYTWYDIQVKQVNAASELVSKVAAVGAQNTVLSDRVATLQNSQTNLVSSDQLELRINDVHNQTREQINVVSTAQGKIAEQMTSLQGALDDVLAKGANEFILDDVGQLLKAANVSVLVLGDREGGLNALRIAEQQLQALGDPRFTAVRQKILSDIAALEAVASTDLEKLTTSIQSLVQRVESLELINEPTQSSENILSLANDDVSASSFGDGLREMGRDLLRLFTIKVQRVDQPPRPLLAPEERYFLNLNLSLALNKAQLAALQKQPMVFKASVDEAKNWVRAYFDVTHPTVQKFIQDLDALAQTNLVVALPSVAQGYAEFIAVRGSR